MTLIPDPDSPGRWSNPRWREGEPGTFAVVIGVSEYDHLPGGAGPLAGETYNLSQLGVSALTAFGFFRWLRDSYAIAGCPLARCWLLASPTPQELGAEPGLGVHPRRPTFDNIAAAVNGWFGEMLRLPAGAGRRGRAFFFFSGHGLEPFPHEQLLLPSDYLDPRFGGNVNRAPSVANIHAALAGVPVGYQFFLIDACRTDPVGPHGVRLEGTRVLNEVANWRSCDARETAPIFYSSVPGGGAWQPSHPSRGLTLFGTALLDGLRAEAGFQPAPCAAGLAVRVSPLATYLRGRLARVLEEHRVTARQVVQLGGNPMDETVTELGPRPAGSGAPAAAPAGVRRFRASSLAAEPVVRQVWSASRVVRLEDRAWFGAAERCPVHRVECDEAGATYRITFTVEDDGGHWFELGEDPARFAVLLPADDGARPRFVMELSVERAGPGWRLVACETRLARDNAGLLGRAAEVWEAFRTRGLTDAVALIEGPFLEELRRDGRSPLAATLAGILLLQARRHDLLGDWLPGLTARLRDWADGPVLDTERRLRQGWDDEILPEATDRLLELEGRDLPCTADCLGFALRQATDLLTYGGHGEDARGRLEKLRDRLRGALQFYDRAVLFSAFAARDGGLGPELVRALTFPRFIKERFPGAAGPVRSVMDRVGWRLEPGVFGAAAPGRRPRGIHATLLGWAEEVSWLAARPNTGAPLVVRWLAGDGPPGADPAVEARPDGAGWRLVVRPDRIAADGRWRGFRLAAAGGPPEADPDRELVYLRRDPAPPAGSPDPVRLVEGGFLAEGWALAAGAGTGEADLLALLGLIWPQMRLLLEGIVAPDDRVAEELVRCCAEADARQQGVRERWQEGLRRGEFGGGAGARDPQRDS